MEKKFFDSEAKEQFKVMLFLLIIVCVLFTLLYNLSKGTSGDAAANTSQTSKDVSDKSEQSKSEVSAISKTEISAEAEVSAVSKTDISAEAEMSEASMQSAPKLDDDQQLIELNNDDIHKGSLILVNKDYPSYVDGEDTVSLYDYKTDSYTVSDTNVYINSSIVDATNQMFDDFYSIYGATDIYIACAYRSYDTQSSLYNAELESNPESGSELVAPPGYSEHQTGYVFDIDHYNESDRNGISFHDDGDDAWFMENCVNYGFILRYPEDKVDITKYEYEAWHYRYVGIAHATYMQQNNLCLEEYIEQIKSTSKDSPLTVNSDDGTAWSMWYEKASDGDTTQISLPKDCEYEISGNNIDGFIITVKSNA